MIHGRQAASASSRLPRTTRVRARHAEWVAERLGERDWRIVEAVNRLRVASGKQLERLFFADLGSARSRTVTRSRVLKRLVEWRVLVPLERRVGGSGRGSTGSVFSLDSAGQRLVRQRQLANAEPARVRRPGTPGERTLRHMLAVSELHVELVELSRAHGFTLAEYQAEPGSWWPNGLGGWIKSDAYVRLEYGEVADHWWVEVDLATESLPTVKRKLEEYLGFVAHGQLGPGGIVPRVLVATRTEARREAIHAVVTRLPAPADKLFAGVTHAETAAYLVEVLTS